MHYELHKRNNWMHIRSDQHPDASLGNLKIYGRGFSWQNLANSRECTQSLHFPSKSSHRRVSSPLWLKVPSGAQLASVANSCTKSERIYNAGQDQAVGRRLSFTSSALRRSPSAQGGPKPWAVGRSQFPHSYQLTSTPPLPIPPLYNCGNRYGRRWNAKKLGKISWQVRRRICKKQEVHDRD